MSLTQGPDFYRADAIEQVTCFRRSKKYNSVISFIYNSSLTLFNNNAYRILSLPTDANEKDILDRVNDLKMKSKLGLKQKPELNTSMLEDIVIDDKVVISASNRLRQPESRLIERLFWFSNINEWPIQDLTSEDIKLGDYLDFFYKTFIHGVHAYPIKTLYNVALLGLVILNNDDYTLKHINTWANVYNLILYVYEQDDFWNTIDSAEKNGGFIQSGKTIKKNKYKGLAIGNLLKPFLALLKKHFDEDINSAENGLKIYYKLNLAEEVKQDKIRQIINKLEDDISHAIYSSLEFCNTNIIRDDYSVEKNDKLCGSTDHKFTTEIGPKLKLFWIFAEEPTRVKRMKEVFFEYLYSMAINYTWADRYFNAQMYLLDAKQIVDAGTTEADKIETMLKKIEPFVAAQKSMGIIDEKGRKINVLSDDNYDHKSCPYCKLDVPKTAIVCSHCKAVIVEKVKSQPTKSYSNAPSKASKSSKAESKSAIYWGVAVVVGLFLFFTIAAWISNYDSNQEEPPSSAVKTEKKIEYANAEYWGETDNGEPHGQGTLTFDDGSKYTGQFQNGNVHGQGTYTWPDGNRHVGGWFDGDASGYGTAYFSNGDRITGGWWGLDNATNATYYWRNGDSATGIVQNGQFIEQ